MDLSQAFVRAAREMIPFAESKIVHDKFHIMKMANEAVDKVCRGEHKRLLKDRDDRLKGSKYFWLTLLEHHSEKQHAKFQSICNLYPSLPGELGPTTSSYGIFGPRIRRGKRRATSEIGISESFVPRWHR